MKTSFRKQRVVGLMTGFLIIVSLLVCIRAFDINFFVPSQNRFVVRVLKGAKPIGSFEKETFENPAIPIHLLYQPGFELLPSEEVCPNKGIDLNVMILVISGSNNAVYREEIRSTWGKIAARHDASLAFIVGISKNNTVNQIIEEENVLYGDIIQGRFTDTYNNLTLKAISALEWSWKYCNYAKFFLKVDDDVFVNPFQLIEFLDSGSQFNSITGEVFQNREPVRDKASKYYVDKFQYQGDMYPDFNTGPSYIFTNDVVKVLYETALNQSFFKLEDVLITGVVAQMIGARRIHNPKFLNNFSKNRISRCELSRIITMHSVYLFNRFEMWKMIMQGELWCKKRKKGLISRY